MPVSPPAPREQSVPAMRRPQRVSRRARADQGERAHRRESPPRASSSPLDSTAPVVLAPLAVAGALCHHWYGCVNVPQWGALTAGACLIIAW